MNACQTSIGEVQERIVHQMEGQVVPYKNQLSLAEVQAALSYDPASGVFLWKISPAKNVKAGTEAGCVKACRSAKDGKSVSYRYIRLGHEVPAARVAWLMSHGEWPSGRVRFRDGDTLNLRLDNLFVSDALAAAYDTKDPEQRRAYHRAHRQQFPESRRDSDLRKKYGVSLQDYLVMHLAQNGKCAICEQPETQMRGGKVKALAVDHCHDTGAIRGLLCCDCNQAIGKLKDDRNILLAAIKYLDKHTSNVINLAEAAHAAEENLL